MRRLLTSAVAAAILAATGTTAHAQDMGRRASMFDLGVYAGGSWTTKWLESPRFGDNITPGTNPVFGAVANYWFTPAFGLRLHGAYFPSSFGERDNDEVMPGFFSGDPRPLNNWLYDINLTFRPLWASNPTGMFGSMYVFLGGGGMTSNPAGNPQRCYPPFGQEGACLPYEGQTNGQGTAGLGFDVISLTDNIGAFAELGVHGYSSPVQIEAGAGNGVEDSFAFTGRLVAGLKLAFGDLTPLPPPPPPPPPPAPPAPPAPAPPPPPADRAIQVCVIQDGQLRQVDATFRPATGDTMVMQAGAQRRFSEAYPATAGYASGATWFVNNQPIRVMNRTYVKFGLTRVVPADQLTRSGEYQGVGVFTETGAASPPEVIYLPVRPGCEFQPYQREQRVRGVRG